jgi:hypothetical protein
MGNGQLRLDEVYLTGSTGQGPAVVGGLALVADEKGLSVLGPQPTSVRTMPWGRVSTMAARQTAHLPDGRGAVTLEMEIGGQALRFLVPEAALGPQGIGILEGRLSSLARIPVRASLPLADPVAIGDGGAPSGGAGVSAPPGVVLPGSGPAPGPVGSSQPVTGPVGGFAPATGGTLLGGQTGPGQAYVQVGKRHPGRGKRVTLVAVVLVLLGGAGAFYEREHKASPTTGASGDSLIAAQVNLDPGQVPGWKGVPGTTAGVLGAYGFRDAPAGHETVLHEAASGFARCAKLPVQESQAALTTLGFSEGLGDVSGQTAFSSSPLFEDPTQAATSAESQALVLSTKAEQTADFSAFTQSDFAPCYSRFLDAVVPDLVGSSMSGTPFALASVHVTRAQPLESGIRAAGFTETFVRKGRTNTVALSGSIEVVGGGRTIAAVETLTAHSFPPATTLKLFASMQQNVAGESS